MVFKPGKDWNGNSKGAPKKQFRRDDFTDELFLESKDRLRIVNNMLFDFAIVDKKPWAFREITRIYFTPPKNRTDAIEDQRNDLLLSTLINVEKQILEKDRQAIEEMISNYTNHNSNEDEKLK